MFTSVHLQEDFFVGSLHINFFVTKETQFIDILGIDFITLIKELSQIQDGKTKNLFTFQGGK